MIELFIACLMVAGAVCAGWEIAWGARSFDHPEEAATQLDTADNVFGLMIVLGVVGCLLGVIFL